MNGIDQETRLRDSLSWATGNLRTAEAELERLKEINTELVKALEWVSQNPWAHPSNMIAVCEEALAKAKGE